MELSIRKDSNMVNKYTLTILILTVLTNVETKPIFSKRITEPYVEPKYESNKKVINYDCTQPTKYEKYSLTYVEDCDTESMKIETQAVEYALISLTYIENIPTAICEAEAIHYRYWCSPGGVFSNEAGVIDERTSRFMPQNVEISISDCRSAWLEILEEKYGILKLKFRKQNWEFQIDKANTWILGKNIQGNPKDDHKNCKSGNGHYVYVNEFKMKLSSGQLTHDIEKRRLLYESKTLPCTIDEEGCAPTSAKFATFVWRGLDHVSEDMNCIPTIVNNRNKSATIKESTDIGKMHKWKNQYFIVTDEKIRQDVQKMFEDHPFTKYEAPFEDRPTKEEIERKHRIIETDSVGGFRYLPNRKWKYEGHLPNIKFKLENEVNDVCGTKIPKFEGTHTFKTNLPDIYVMIFAGGFNLKTGRTKNLDYDTLERIVNRERYFKQYGEHDFYPEMRQDLNTKFHTNTNEKVQSKVLNKLQDLGKRKSYDKWTTSELNSGININAHTDGKIDYVAYKQHLILSEEDNNLFNDICELSKTLKYEILNQATINPKNAGFLLTGNRSAFASIHGSIVWLYYCTTEENNLYIKDKCYTKIPIAVEGELMFVDPQTRKRTKHANEMDCENELFTYFQLDPEDKDSWFRLTPNLVAVADIPLVFSPENQNSKGTFLEHSATDSGLYTPEITKKFWERILTNEIDEELAERSKTAILLNTYVNNGNQIDRRFYGKFTNQGVPVDIHSAFDKIKSEFVSSYIYTFGIVAYYLQLAGGYFGAFMLITWVYKIIIATLGALELKKGFGNGLSLMKCVIISFTNLFFSAAIRELERKTNEKERIMVVNNINDIPLPPYGKNTSNRNDSDDEHGNNTKILPPTMLTEIQTTKRLEEVTPTSIHQPVLHLGNFQEVSHESEENNDYVQAQNIQRNINEITIYEDDPIPIPSPYTEVNRMIGK